MLEGAVSFVLCARVALRAAVCGVGNCVQRIIAVHKTAG